MKVGHTSDTRDAIQDSHTAMTSGRTRLPSTSNALIDPDYPNPGYLHKDLYVVRVSAITVVLQASSSSTRIANHWTRLDDISPTGE